MLALALEVLGTLRGFPLPMMGPMDMSRWDLSGAHIAERSALFVLIALGEGLLVTGFAFVELDLSVEATTAIVLAFASAAAMWWIYFDHGERIGAEAMEDSDAPGLLARTAYTFVHLLVIGGIVLTGVGDKELLGHPHDQSLSAVVTVLGGPLLFLAGTLLFRRLLERRWVVPQVMASSASSPSPRSRRCSTRSAWGSHRPWCSRAWRPWRRSIACVGAVAAGGDGRASDPASACERPVMDRLCGQRLARRRGRAEPVRCWRSERVTAGPSYALAPASDASQDCADAFAQQHHSTAPRHAPSVTHNSSGPPPAGRRVR